MCEIYFSFLSHSPFLSLSLFSWALGLDQLLVGRLCDLYLFEKNEKQLSPTYLRLLNNRPFSRRRRRRRRSELFLAGYLEGELTNDQTQTLQTRRRGRLRLRGPCKEQNLREPWARRRRRRRRRRLKAKIGHRSVRALLAHVRFVSFRCFFNTNGQGD